MPEANTKDALESSQDEIARVQFSIDELDTCGIASSQRLEEDIVECEREARCCRRWQHRSATVAAALASDVYSMRLPGHRMRDLIAGYLVQASLPFYYLQIQSFLELSIILNAFSALHDSVQDHHPNGSEKPGSSPIAWRAPPGS